MPAHLRPYQADDLEQVYEICLRTGAAGHDASHLMTEPRLLGDLFAAPYVVLEPERAFVLDDGTGTASGYVVGALDTRAFEARCEAEWWPEVRARYPAPTGRGGLDDLFIGYLHGMVPAPAEMVDRYPSHLHIDLLSPFQSGGWGRRMMDTFYDTVRAAGSPGVHLSMSAANERAVGFYRHLGLTELDANELTLTFGLRL